MFRRVQCHTENVSLSQESVFKNINFYNRECVAASERGHHHEISAAMLTALNVDYVVIGHSERRRLFGETDEAQETQAFIRSVIASISDQTVAAKVRIQYGGSVKPDNAKALLQKPDIDGALVGGASLDPRGFVQIIRSAVAVAEQQDFR